MKGLALNLKELLALQEKPATKEQKEAKMETKKLFIIVLVVIFGICFITTLSSIQRMDSNQMMVDPENPSITAQAFSEPTDIRVPSTGSGAVSAGLVVGR